MGRGILFGSFWGLLVGALVLAVASLLGEVPGADGPRTDAVEVPAGSEFDQAREDTAPVVDVTPSAQPTVAAPVPEVTAPREPVQPTLGDEVTASAAVPETGAASELPAPPAGASGSGVVVATEGPAEPVTPEVPETQSEPTVTEDVAVADTASSDPVAAPAGSISEDPVQPQAPGGGEAALTAEAPREDTSAPAETTETPETPEAPAPSPTVTEADEGAAAATEDAPLRDDEVLETADAEDVGETAPEVPSDETEPEVTENTAPEPEAPAPSAGGFANLAPNVQTNRLPTVGGTRDTDAAPARAIDSFAETADWSGPDDRPLMSLILLDEDADAAALPALASFGRPLTFAVPASAPGAAEAAAGYRAAGHEVVLVTDLPGGAVPSDIEVAFEAYLAAVPEAVAVLDGSGNGFNGDRRVVNQVVEILADTGHGLVTYATGLGTAEQVARREGVPASSVFRDLDGNGQDATVIRRFLDQAAFRAGQEGQVILLARMRADTISALLIWAQQDRASRVNIAPLSQVLLGNGAS